MSKQPLNKIKKEIQKYASPKKADASLRFFKTAPGQYGHGDQFLGLTVPESRTVAKKFFDSDLATLQSLLQSPWHEERLIGLMILVDNYERRKKSELKANDKSSKTPKTIPVKNTKQAKGKLVSPTGPFKNSQAIVDFYLKNKS